MSKSHSHRGVLPRRRSQSNHINDMVATRRSSAAAKLVAADGSHVDSLARESDGSETVNLFKLAEIAKHNCPSNCWVVVRRQVYDVTPFVSKHPGGDLIFLRAGTDCTALFDSYHPHPAKVRPVLAKYFIGDVADGEEAAEGLGLEDELAPGTFYAVLKQRVADYMAANKLSPRTSTALFVKSAVILATLALSYYGTFFAFTSFAASLLNAVVLGVAMAEVGVSIQHDANHGAFSVDSRIGSALGATLDLVGASSFMWRQQHMGGHHVWTNVHGLDPDIRVSDADVRRVTPYQPWHPYQAYQHVYLAVLYGLLALKSVLVDDFLALTSGAIGTLQLTPLTRGEATVFWVGKVVFGLLFLVAPLAVGRHSVLALVPLWLAAEFVTGWMLAFLFQVAHVVEGVAYLQPGGAPEVPKGWATAQVAASADFSHGSFFWTHLSGGLNYQVVHHLFPALCHTHYPAIAPIVIQTCKEFNVPYRIYPTFISALKAHFAHLKTMGSSLSMTKVPSLATIG